MKPLRIIIIGLLCAASSNATADHHHKNMFPSSPSGGGFDVPGNIDNIADQLNLRAWIANSHRENARQADAYRNIARNLPSGVVKSYDLYTIDRGGHGYEQFYAWTPSGELQLLEPGARFRGSRFISGVPNGVLPGTPAPYTQQNPPLGYTPQNTATNNNANIEAQREARRAAQEARMRVFELQMLRRHQRDKAQFESQGGPYRSPALGTPDDTDCKMGNCDGRQGKMVNPDLNGGEGGVPWTHIDDSNPVQGPEIPFWAGGPRPRNQVPTNQLVAPNFGRLNPQFRPNGYGMGPRW